MSAAEKQIDTTVMTADDLAELQDIMQGGSPVGQSVRPGQINPRSWHFGYSAGERELRTRAADTGYASILPGLLIPLRPFRKRIPNDTMEALADAEAPQDIEMECLPRDAADALMSVYQHRGFRILLPFIGMDRRDGEMRAAKLFRVVNPPIPCARKPERLSAFDQRILARHCVSCRLDDLTSERSLNRIEKAKLSTRPNIEYGFEDDGRTVRLISDQEAVVIVHEMLTLALQEHYDGMIDVLQQSKADVLAGQHGPGKKNWDKRDVWYFLMAHKAPDDLEAVGAIGRAQGDAMADRVGGAITKALANTGGGGKGLTEAAVNKLLVEQETRHQAQLETMREEFLAMLTEGGK